MPLVDIENLPETILTTKKELKAALPKYREIFQDVEAEMRRRVSEIVKEREAGQPVIPIVQYADIEGGTVPEDLVSKIKRRGACVIRSTFSQEQATTWDQEIAHYVEENHLDAKLANAAEDRYFGTLASAKPQIYGIYWSRPQVQARQSETLSKVRIFLNHLWKAESEGVAISILTRLRFTQTAFAVARQARHPLASRLMRMADRWSAGSTRIFGRFIGMCSPETGRNMTRLTLPIDPRHGDPVTGRLLHVPNFPRLDSPHPAGSWRRNTSAHSHCRIDGVYPLARVAGRCR